MTGPLDRASAFGRWLVQDRDHADALLAAAAARRGDAGPVRDAVHEVAAVADGLAGDGDLDPRVGRALLAATTDLAARDRWRAGAPERTVVTQVVPRVGALVHARPDVVVPLLVASARAVARSADPRLVADLLADAPATDDAGHLRAAVLVATWRAGGVRYRAAALRAAATLPAPLAAAVLGLAPGTAVADVLAAHDADRWWWPGAPGAVGVVRRVGGFRGFGGSWLAVPRVSSPAPAGCHVRADGLCWVVVADAHGSAVVRLDGPDEQVRAPAPALPVPWDDEVTGWAAAGGDARVLVVSRRHSYALDVVRVA